MQRWDKGNKGKKCKVKPLECGGHKMAPYLCAMVGP